MAALAGITPPASAPGTALAIACAVILGAATAFPATAQTAASRSDLPPDATLDPASIGPPTFSRPPPEPVPAPGRGEGSVLTAAQVIFDTKTSLLTATGNVELTRQNRRLLADQLVYDQKTDKVKARGNVVIVETSGRAYYGDEMDITGDLRDGTVEGFRALVGEQIRIASTTATREEGTRNILDAGVFSPCPVCVDSGPLWQIRAERVIWDETTKTITYRNATFDLFGVPVGYTPIFSQPDPTVRRKTGFLTPIVGYNSTIGATAQIPYYVDLAPNRDVTISPLLTSNAGPLLGLELRDRQTYGTTFLSGSVTYTDPSDTDQQDRRNKVWRGHINGYGRYTLSPEWTSGFDLYLVSDNTYLDRYDFTDADILTNSARVQRIVGSDFVSFEGYGFQGLREGEDQDALPIVLPLAEARLKSSPLAFGSHATFDSSFVALTRVDGLDSRRFTNEVGWELPKIGPIGDVWRVRTSLRGDIYNYEGDPETLSASGGQGNAARAIPRATFDWSWPLVGEAGTLAYYIEPTTMATVTPYGLNDDDIPNEDSQVFEWDETNLFEPDRFTGYDLVDDGLRVAYGLRFGSLDAGPLDVNGLVGQNWQPRENDRFTTSSGAGSQLSDYVGRIDFRPASYLNFRYRFRADRENLELRRNDVKVTLGPRQVRLDLNYVELTDEPSDLTDQRSRREGSATLRLQPNDRWAFAIQARRDLEENRPVSNLFGLVYKHPCLQLIAGVEQSYASVGELEDELTFKVQLTLSTLGTVEGGL